MRAGNTGGAYRTMSVSTRGPVTVGAGVTVPVDADVPGVAPGGVAPPVHHTLPYEDRQPGVRVLDGVDVGDGSGELLEGDTEGVDGGGGSLVGGGGDEGVTGGVVCVGAGSLVGDGAGGVGSGPCHTNPGIPGHRP